MEDAKVQFANLVQQYPDDDELRYSLALVCLEAKAWDEAKGYLEELIERESHVDSAHLNLGRIAEENNDPQAALLEYAKVGPGNDYLPAQLRQADILMSNGRTDEAEKTPGRGARGGTGLRDPAVPDPGRNLVGQQSGRARLESLATSLAAIPRRPEPALHPCDAGGKTQ